jgi:hypothetical protein
VGKYKVNIVHSASGIYSYAKKTVTIKSLANTPKISLSSKSVIRGKYIYAYLKDGAGKVLSDKKLTFTLNGRTYVKKTNSNGRAALKLSMAAKSYSTKISFDAVSVYSSKSVTKTIKVINDPYKNSILNIEKAATNVRNYVDDHGKLPETVTVGSETVTIEEFSYLMGEAIVALNKGSTGKVSILTGIGNVNSTNTSLNTKVFKPNISTWPTAWYLI